MRSLPFPRRLQLVKLLRAHGLRDVERLREDELKEALARLAILLPDLEPPPFAPAASLPSSAMGVARAQPPPPPPADDDDPHCLPRFKEPRVFLPDAERTFLRCIAVRPRMLFFTWDLHKDIPRDRPAWIQVFLRDTLGDPPEAADVAAQHPSFTVDVDVRAPGWYVSFSGERLAVAAALVVDGQRVATSNLALTPPARPAPPGPLWEATILPGTSRKALRKSGLLRPKLPQGATLVVKGEAARVDAQGGGEEEVDFSFGSASAIRMRALAPHLLQPVGEGASSSSSAALAGRKP